MTFSDPSLEHFGVKGMHWGVRKNRASDTSPDHTRAKKVAKVAGAAALVGGAAVAVYVLNKNGHLPVQHLNFSGTKISKAGTSAFTKYKSPPKTRVMSEAERHLQERVTHETINASMIQSARAVRVGQDAMGKIKPESWHKAVNDVMKGIDEANASQDAWIRSVGFDHVINKRTGSGR